ncbi:Prolyl tripeptidyl peptidase precursor (plasmid) [Piscirickettsia salmonis]|nr:S9 family peptidase [Piscirickettsia salmonis]QGO25522.1 Prolyl tripeptidyl peptidase precursor [Piscirickettsia salmonis]
MILIMSPAISSKTENKLFSWKPEQLMNIKQISELDLSSSAPTLAYVVDFYKKDNKNIWTEKSSIKILSLTTKETHKVDYKDEDSWMPKWSPNGHYLAFLSKKVSEKSNDNALSLIKIWSKKTNKIYLLTETKNNIKTLSWSRNGNFIAYVTENKKDFYIDKNKLKIFSSSVRNDEMHIIEIDYKNIKKNKDKIIISKYIQGNKFSYIGNLSWSKDDKDIAFSHDIGDRNDLWNLGIISTINLMTNKINTINIFKQRMIMQQPHYSPDGQYLLFTASPEQVWSPRFCIYMQKIITKSVTKLACSFDQDPKLVGWSKSGKNIIFTENFHTWRNIYSLSTDREDITTKVVKINKSNSLIDTVSINSKGEIAIVQQNSKKAEEIYLTNLIRYQPQIITNINTRYTKFSETLGKTEKINWKSKDGLTISGLLTYPENYNKSKKYPLIIELHGGPADVFQNRFIGRRSVFPIATFSKEGYFYLRPNVRGSSAYGVYFKELNHGDWGGKDYQDIMDGIQYLNDKNIIDSKKISIIGWSYGGYLTAQAITHSPLFKAAIIGGGITDLASYSVTNDLPNYLKLNLGGYLWDKPKFYQKRSPIYAANHVTTPTLLMYGENDIRVPLSQGVEFFNILKLRNIPSMMLIYPKQYHSLSDPNYIIDAGIRNVSWINKYSRAGTVAKNLDLSGV